MHRTSVEEKAPFGWVPVCEACGMLSGPHEFEADAQVATEHHRYVEHLKTTVEEQRRELRAFRECTCPVEWDRSCPTHVPPIG